MQQVACILITFFASAIGSICEIGCGIIIKPVLDATGLYSVNSVNFMSGCAVLAMATYSVVAAAIFGGPVVKRSVSTYLAIGAAVGGAVGKQAFVLLGGGDAAGVVQAGVLFFVTLGTAIYTVMRKKIHPHHVRYPPACVAIGFSTGALSAFLGIGGGPINLAVLHFFFGMDTKAAAHNSLYIIMLSQLVALFCGTIPEEVPAALLAGMITCGILGGVLGRKANAKIDAYTTDRLFLGLLGLIMWICANNFIHYF